MPPKWFKTQSLMRINSVSQENSPMKYFLRGQHSFETPLRINMVLRLKNLVAVDKWRFRSSHQNRKSNSITTYHPRLYFTTTGPRPNTMPGTPGLRQGRPILSVLSPRLHTISPRHNHMWYNKNIRHYTKCTMEAPKKS